MSRTGITLLALSTLSFLCTSLGWSLPMVKLFDLGPVWLGNCLRVVAIFAGGWLVLRPRKIPNPLAAKRWKRFFHFGGPWWPW